MHVQNSLFFVHYCMLKGRETAHGSRKIGAYVNSKQRLCNTQLAVSSREAEEGSAGWGCVETYINTHCAAVYAAAVNQDASFSPKLIYYFIFSLTFIFILY